MPTTHLGTVLMFCSSASVWFSLTFQTCTKGLFLTVLLTNHVVLTNVGWVLYMTFDSEVLSVE